MAAADRTATYAALRRLFEPIPDQHREFLVDTTFRRYVDANGGNLADAQKQLEATLKWRESYRPHEINPQDLRTYLDAGKMYVHGFDRMGRPVFLTKKRKDGPLPPEITMRMVMYNVEKVMRLMHSTGTHQLVWLIDLSDYTRGNSPPMSSVIDLLKTLMAHYPEMLGTAIIVDAPFIFSVLWRAIALVAPKQTVAKVHFVKGTPEQKFAVLRRWFDADQLDPAYGGTRPFVYAFDAVEGAHNEAALLRAWHERQAALSSAPPAAAAAATSSAPDGVEGVEGVEGGAAYVDASGDESDEDRERAGDTDQQ